MNNLVKLPYEISLWEDRLTVVYEDGSEDEGLAELSAEKIVVGQYYKERKLCVIGSNTMGAQIGVVDPVLNRKTDGTSTLTFSIYAKYYDEETGEFLENPFIQYLTNERKVKLKYYPNGELRWLDFVIKKIDESSENYKFTYTATDLFINELSKTGYNLEFDVELENNQGTVEKLAGDILRGSDWEVGSDSELIQQTITESLYKITLNVDLVAYDIFTNKEKIIPEGAEIYAFYSVLANKVYDYFQFIYDPSNNYPRDENNVVHNVENYYCKFEELPTWRAIEFYNGFRGERYVRSQQIIYDSVLERQVRVYTGKNNEKVYGYEETEYYGPSLVQTFITNGETILSDSGWRQANKLDLEVDMTPSAREKINIEADETRKFYLAYNQTEANNYLLNTGLRDNAEAIGEISINDKFVFSINLGEQFADDCQPRLQLIKYVLNKDENKNLDDEILYDSFPNGVWDGKDIFYLTDISLQRAIPKEELIEIDPKYRFGIFLSFVNNESEPLFNYNARIFGAQLFRQYWGTATKNENSDEKQEGIILPNGKVLYKENGFYKETHGIAESHVNTKYFYYPARTANSTITKPEQIQYLHIGDKLEQYKEVYNSNFEKIRSISKKESNRFDLLQTLSETFECWCRFDVWHKDTGEIMLVKDTNWLLDSGDAFSDEKVVFLGGDAYSIEEITFYGGDYLSSSDNPFQQMKFVTFHSKIGQKKNIGFRYGINLKSVSRTLDSNAIATKLIVKSNTNEFAEGGSCNIALAKENPSGENFVYDFTHYINQGLMNEENLINDLYYYDDEDSDNSRKWIGLFVRLKGLNTRRDQLIVEQNALMRQYNHSKSDYETSRVRLSAIEDEIYDLEADYNGYKTDNDDYDKTNEKLLAIVYDICRLKKEQSEMSATYNKAKIDMEILKENIQTISNELRTIETATAALISTFEQKYIRFIQEASWTSEDYTDHNLYYIDAETTLHKSAQPKVSYNINIIELNQIEGYENYSFDLGDISYVIDADFFGWTEKDGIKTPRREEIVITETSTNFHSPDKCSIKAQNYRSAFEDLFRRLTATSQQLQFHNGEFQRAADVVDANGNIAPSSLADAFANNAYLLSNVANQTVKWNEFGITTTDTKNPAEITRITSGGIFLTSDGGEKWTTGITSKGINAKMITTGVLDTGKVNIYNGSQKSFTWDSQGINAYKEEGGKYSTNNFVRFSQDGIYGMESTQLDEDTSSIENIKQKSSFYLGWDGLHLNKGKITFGKNGVEAEGLDELIKVDTKDVVNEIVGKYLGGNSTTEIGGQYVITPYIGGGYLHIVDGNNSVTIDPQGIKENKMFSINTAKGNVMSVDSDGNLSITGIITAEKGSIGGWKIGKDGLYCGETYDTASMGMSPTNPDFAFWSGGSTVETAKFRVNQEGKLYATEGKIGDWTLTSRGLNYGETYYFYRGWDDKDKVTIASTEKNNWRLVLGRGEKTKNYDEDGKEYYTSQANFGVDKDGKMYANGAIISGQITATVGGNIGGWAIEEHTFAVDGNDYTGPTLSATRTSDQDSSYYLTPKGIYWVPPGELSSTSFKSWIDIIKNN